MLNTFTQLGAARRQPIGTQHTKLRVFYRTATLRPLKKEIVRAYTLFIKEIGMDMNCVAFQAYPAMALCDRPRCTTAELNDTTVVFRDGEWAKGGTLHADCSGRMDTIFDLKERTYNRLHADLVAWLAAPRYSVRPDVERWL